MGYSSPEKQKEFRIKNPEKIREYKRTYKIKHPDRVKESNRKSHDRYYIKNKDTLIKKHKEYHKKINYSNKYQVQSEARSIANKIPIKNGQLCQLCNTSLAIERHHPDYSKPTEIIFVCRRCHWNIHFPKLEGVNNRV
jgi:hypothetical protein